MGEDVIVKLVGMAKELGGNKAFTDDASPARWKLLEPCDWPQIPTSQGVRLTSIPILPRLLYSLNVTIITISSYIALPDYHLLCSYWYFEDLRK
jgi:hypothetical protein